MRPIAPRTGYPEIAIAEEQEEYLPITVAVYPVQDNPTAHMLLLRYTLTKEERQAVAAGEDIYLMHFYPNGGPMTPVQAQVGSKGWTR